MIGASPRSAIACLFLAIAACARVPEHETVTVREAAAWDVSPPLSTLLVNSAGGGPGMGPVGCEPDACGGLSPSEEDDERGHTPATTVFTGGAASEQTSQGTRRSAILLESFDGHGFGTSGPNGEGGGNNPSDNSMAVGPNHVVETVNSRISVYTKKGAAYAKSGTPLFGPIGSHVLFSGFGGECERSANGDFVVRYDQLANRWLYVMPLFRRAVAVPAGKTEAPYGMCYALSTSSNPLGPYNRYYFERDLFPDYPRPAIWPDGYYVPTSTGDNLLPDGRLPEKHACVVERDKMLAGLPAREQCVIMTDINFLNNADIDGWGLPPAGAPNIMMATGGAQLRNDFEDDGIYAWKMYVDWTNTANTKVTGPVKIVVAPYHYMCDGQLTRCVPQPGTDMRLDSQGDKIMQRLVYRNINGVESIVAVHSVNTAAGKGGVRWYEFRLNASRDPVLHQQSTYAPDSFYRWMASPGMDRQGNIGIGYSFGGTPHFAGQRFAARLAGDTPGELTLRETVLIDGAGAQTNTLRWQDYTQLSMDPVDDCTFWYVGDYLKKDARSYTTRIGSFRLPGCMRANLSGTTYFDVNHNGVREPNEPGLRGMTVTLTLTRTPQDSVVRAFTDSIGDYRAWLPADPAYSDARNATVTARPLTSAGWSQIDRGTAFTARSTVPMRARGYAVMFEDRDDVTRLDFGFACAITNTGGVTSTFWSSDEGRRVLASNHQPAPGRGGRGGAAALPGWRGVLGMTRHLVNTDGTRFVVMDSVFDSGYEQFRTWLGGTSTNPAYALSVQLAVASLNVAYGGQSGSVTIHDPVMNDWPTVSAMLSRVSTLAATATPTRASVIAYRDVLSKLNANTALVTPNSLAGCPPSR